MEDPDRTTLHIRVSPVSRTHSFREDERHRRRAHAARQWKEKPQVVTCDGLYSVFKKVMSASLSSGLSSLNRLEVSVLRHCGA